MRHKDKIARKEQHPWRVCPLGSHFVKEHKRRTKNGTTVVRSHCRKNHLGKEILNIDEINEMFERNKDRVTQLPNKSNIGYKNENHYDERIGLWTQFWNETFSNTPPLDANWVKALMASESGFNPDVVNRSGKHNFARGLLQITEQTYKISVNSKGELKDVLFRIDEKDLFVPDVNVAVGTRWIFRKRETLRSKTGKDPNWEEVMWEYKGIYDQSGIPKADDEKQYLRKLYDKIIKNH